MKNILFILALLIYLCSFGQKSNDKKLAEVAFADIENVPVYPGCRGNNLKKRKCLSEKIKNFVAKNFNTDIFNNLRLVGRQRISVIFKIDKTGNVIDVRVRAPHLVLEQEAVRVINLLPKMKPGLQNGKPVIVPYSLPIIFAVQKKEDPNAQI